MRERDRDRSSLVDTLEHSMLSRRRLLKRSITLGLGFPVISSLLAACGGDDDDDDGEEAAADATPTTGAVTEPTATTAPSGDDEPTEAEADEEPTPASEAEETPEEAPMGEGVRGGTLRLTLTGDLGTFDTQAVTQSVVGYVCWHIWEHLFTYDEEMQVTPELVESYEASDDAMTHIITVRHAKFHNGNDMTAEDVAASIDRWRQIAGTAGALADTTESLTAVDDQTIEWTLSEPFAIMPTVLSRQNSGCAILPKEVMDAIGTEPLVDEEHYVGTGSYRFVEHQPDRHIKLERFEDYVSRQEEPSGYAGFKHQYVDEIFFIPVTEEPSAVAGLRAGDYDYVDSLSPLQFQPLEDDANVTTEILPAPTWGCFVFNFADGICAGHEGSGLLLRQAILATLDMEQIALGAYGEGWYRMHPSISFEGLPWETEAGGEFYNQADPERGRELLEEAKAAGYGGEPIIWMATREYQDHYDTTALAVQQLEDAGFEIDFQDYDWATIGERRLEKDGTIWNMMTTGHSFRPDPVQLSGIGSAETYGFWESPAIADARIRFTSTPDFDSRFQVWEEIQTLYLTEVPRMKVADQKAFHAMAANLRGWTPQVQIQVAHWNHWLE